MSECGRCVSSFFFVMSTDINQKGKISQTNIKFVS